MEKAMAPHSSTLAWRIPGTEEPGGLPSMGSHRVRHDWSDLAAAAAVLKLHPLINAAKLSGNLNLNWKWLANVSINTVMIVWVHFQS